jgi:hypothetical protein
MIFHGIVGADAELLTSNATPLNSTTTTPTQHPSAVAATESPHASGRSGISNQSAQPIRSGISNQSAQPIRSGISNQSAQPIRSGISNQSAQPIRSGISNQSAQPTACACWQL